MCKTQLLFITLKWNSVMFIVIINILMHPEINAGCISGDQISGDQILFFIHYCTDPEI